MQIALRAGLTVGAVLSLRFGLAAIGMGAMLLIRREPLARRSVLDGHLPRAAIGHDLLAADRWLALHDNVEVGLHHLLVYPVHTVAVDHAGERRKTESRHCCRAGDARTVHAGPSTRWAAEPVESW